MPRGTKILFVAGAGNALNHVTEHEIAGVAVAHFFAGGKIERLVAYDRNRFRDRRRLQLQGFVFRQVGEIGNPGRVGQQIEDGNRLPRRGRLGHVLLNRIIELQFSAFLEHQNRCGRELLRDRAEPELRRRCVGNIPFKICRPVSFTEQDITASSDQHRPHERLVAGVTLDDIVHAFRVLCEARGRDKQDDERMSDGSHAMSLQQKSPENRPSGVGCRRHSFSRRPTDVRQTPSLAAMHTRSGPPRARRITIRSRSRARPGIV
jgi:hypothetical protein